MLKVSNAGCPGESPAILAQFTLEMGATAKIAKKTSRSFKVNDVYIHTDRQTPQ